MENNSNYVELTKFKGREQFWFVCFCVQNSAEPFKILRDVTKKNMLYWNTLICPARTHLSNHMVHTIQVWNRFQQSMMETVVYVSHASNDVRVFEWSIDCYVDLLYMAYTHCVGIHSKTWKHVEGKAYKANMQCMKCFTMVWNWPNNLMCCWAAKRSRCSMSQQGVLDMLAPSKNIKCLIISQPFENTAQIRFLETHQPRNEIVFCMIRVWLKALYRCVAKACF